MIILLALQKKSKHTGVQSQHKNLSIQFSLDGFSFCIVDIPTQNIVLYTAYTFERSVTTPELLLDKVTSIFNQDKYLQGDFKEVKVIHTNNLYSFVPNTFFDKKNLKTYLNYTIKTLETDHIVFDDIEDIHAKNVYIPFVNINNYLFQNFGSFDFNHHSTVLIRKILEYAKKTPDRHFFVQVFKNNLDIIVTKGNTLILYNTFSYTTKEDFMYYILFVAEQLEMDPNEFIVTFLGNIDEDSELYKITYTYIRYIEFIKITENFFTNSEDFSTHANYILIS